MNKIYPKTFVTLFVWVLLILFSCLASIQAQSNNNPSTDKPDAQIPFLTNSSKSDPLPHINGEEVFGNNTFIFGPSGTRGRGNFFTCTNSAILVEHRLYLNITASTTAWFCVYEGDSQVGTYNLVNATNVSPQGPGEGWYSSGQISVMLTAGKFYCIIAQWEAPANYYNQQNVSPYPFPASFGELTGGVGWSWVPTYSVPPSPTQNVTADAFGDSVAYYQTIVTEFPPPPPVLETPANGETGVFTSLSLRWRKVNNATSYGVQVALNSNFSPSTILFDQNVTDTTQTLTGLAENTTYHWRVNAQNNFGTSNWAQRNFTTVSTIALSQTVPYPSHSDPASFSQSDYRIVGLPGQSNLAVGTVLSGEHGKDWTAYWDDGSASDYLIQFDNSAIFQFSVGRAFWIIRRGDLPINQTVTAAPLNNSGMVTIPLNTGDWTLITNPFPVQVKWSEILNANVITNTPPLYKFSNGNFITINPTNDFIEPYIGYLFDHETIGLNSLAIPYPHGSSIPLSPEILDPALWRVHIGLSNGKNIDRTTSLGISEEASLERDHLDFHKPRGFYEGPTVFFKHPQWDPDFSSFATDIRPPFEDLESWNFEVFSQTATELELSFSGMEDIPSQFEVYLIDENGATYLNLREKSLYRFTSLKAVSNFSILVGKQGLVNESLESVLPREFVLGSNYPNPFNPSTVIPVDIPSKMEAELVIYNILGKKVKTLYSGFLEPGRHGFRWDGRDSAGNKAASGVYLYRFTTRAGVFLTKKMILLK